MFKSLKVVRLAAGAAAALLGGFATPAWATYGGGACHRCAPAPVVATQLQRRQPGAPGRDRLPDRL